MMPEQLRQRMVKPILVLFAILLFSSYDSVLCAQTGMPMFQVIHLPRKTGYSKEKLNTEIAALKNKEAVKKVVKAKNFPSETSIVLQINRPNTLSTYWTINTSSPTDKEDNRIIMQSRDNTTTKFFKLSEFRNFFKDTLAVIDTLAVELLIRDDDYPDDQYSLSSACAKKIGMKKIPFQNGKLLFTKSLLNDCNETAAINIYNNKNPERILASCKMVFLSTDQKEMLLSIAGSIKAKEPGSGIKDVALVLYSYSLQHFGRLHFPQLLNWLEKSSTAF